MLYLRRDAEIRLILAMGATWRSWAHRLEHFICAYLVYTAESFHVIPLRMDVRRSALPHGTYNLQTHAKYKNEYAPVKTYLLPGTW